VPRITEVRAYLLRTELEKEFRTSVRSSRASESIVISVLDDEGQVGLGEGVPTHPYFEGDTTASLVKSLRRLSDKVVGEDCARLGHLTEVVARSGVKSHSACAAIDIALHDLFARRLGVPLSDLLGQPKRSMLTSYTIGIQGPDEMASEAKRMVDEGFKRIKIKIGTGLGEDIDRVKKVSFVLGDEARLSVDANQAYSLAGAIRLCKFLSKLEALEFLEQPLARSKVKETAALRRKTDVKIMLDEGVRDAREAMSAVKAEEADYINVKLSKCGGIAEAMRIAAVCEAGGLGCMVGCYSENSVGIAAGMHFALASRAVEFADLDSDLMCPRKLATRGGAWIRDGARGVSPSLGLGIEELNRSLLRELFAKSAG